MLSSQHPVSGEERASLWGTTLFACWGRNEGGGHGSVTVGSKWTQELSVRREWLLGADSTFFFFFRAWKKALKRFAFKEASLLILDLFSGATLVHRKTAFKDIIPSPCTYQTWSMISDSWQHYSAKSCGRFVLHPVEDDWLLKDQKELLPKSSQPGWLSHSVQDSCTVKTSPPWLRQRQTTSYVS